MFESNMTKVNIAGKDLCVVKVKDSLYACTTRCPHAGADLADGRADQAGNIHCPLHGYAFNVITGRDTYNEGYFLKRFPVRVDAEGIFIGLPKE